MINENQLLEKLEKLFNSEDKNRKFGDTVGAKIKELVFDFERNRINKLAVYFDRADMEEVVIIDKSLIGKAKDTDALVKKIARIVVNNSKRTDLLWHVK